MKNNLDLHLVDYIVDVSSGNELIASPSQHQEDKKTNNYENNTDAITLINETLQYRQPTFQNAGGLKNMSLLDKRVSTTRKGQIQITGNDIGTTNKPCDLEFATNGTAHKTQIKQFMNGPTLDNTIPTGKQQHQILQTNKKDKMAAKETLTKSIIEMGKNYEEAAKIIATGSMGEDDDGEIQQLVSRKPILKRALTPCLFTMKVFGFYYDYDGESSSLNRFTQIYTVLVNLAIIYAFISNVAKLWYCKTSDDYYMQSNLIIYSMKGLIQVIIVHYLCRRCVLWTFINRLNIFLADIKVCSEVKKHERNFTLLCYIGYGLSIIFTVGFGVSIFIVQFIRPEGELIDTIDISPFEVTPVLRYVQVYFELIVLVAWVIPVSLCMVLITSLIYTFEEFYRYLDTTKNHVCRRLFLYDMRRKFLRLTELCGDFDDMMSLLLMFSFLLDIILVCLLLRMVTCSYDDSKSKVLAATWLFPPLFSLMELSQRASKLYDTGQRMHQYIQDIKIDNIDLNTKTELDLLMFHLSNEPVVMTLWRMIPLNRSIIVSVGTLRSESQLKKGSDVVSKQIPTEPSSFQETGV